MLRGQLARDSSQGAQEAKKYTPLRFVQLKGSKALGLEPRVCEKEPAVPAIWGTIYRYSTHAQAAISSSISIYSNRNSQTSDRTIQ